MNEKKNGLVPVGRQLKREGFDTDPVQYAVTLNEFEQLKSDGDEDCDWMSFEEYNRLEIEGRNDFVRLWARRSYELLDTLPLTVPYKSGVRLVRESHLEILKQLSFDFEETVASDP